MKSLPSVTKIVLLLITFGVGIAIVVGIRMLMVKPASDGTEIVAPADSDQDSPMLDFPEPTPTPENTSLADKSPAYLCNHLVDLKKMAWYGVGFSNDAVYDALKQKGYYATPCLVDKITETKIADDPTGAPFMSGYTYRTGDTAVFMLMDISEMHRWPKGMMPIKYERMFKTEGRFAYFEYVDVVPSARKQVQRWWRNWVKTCRPECAVVPSLEQ